MSFAPADTYRFEFSTYANTGALADAATLPTATLVVNGTDTGTTVTITKPAATTGRYKGSVTLSGLTIGDVFYVRVSATVGTLSGEACTATQRCDTVPTAAQNASETTGSAPFVALTSGIAAVLVDTGEIKASIGEGGNDYTFDDSEVTLG
jgi:hypothetical protein